MDLEAQLKASDEYIATLEGMIAQLWDCICREDWEGGRAIISEVFSFSDSMLEENNPWP